MLWNYFVEAFDKGSELLLNAMPQPPVDEKSKTKTRLQISVLNLKETSGHASLKRIEPTLESASRQI